MNRYSPKPYVEIKHPDWCKNATIYEVNIRQYTSEGTFKAFESHLPRLKKMGVDILWLMPIHPIGEKNRKGTLGSYYSIKDFYDVNPEFGTKQDLKSLIEKIHDMDMYVILDWVANHTSWDNPLVEQHPEWYKKTKDGQFQPPVWWDWDDIIVFDFDNPEFREYMTNAMKYWIREYDLDGYRCDVAGFVPVDFWDNVREELDEIKPVFMLAEWDSRDVHKKAFDMSYGWKLWGDLKDAVNRKNPAAKITEYIADHINSFPENAIKMNFTENHDKNSWEGTQYSNFGDALQACMVFCSTIPGMPLVYSGQEAGLDRSLDFFEKDPIDWKEHPNYDIYSKLFNLKHNYPALWNGSWGGEMIQILNNQAKDVISYARELNEDQVIVVINFSSNNIQVELNCSSYQGAYTDIFSGKKYKIKNNLKTHLGLWSYLVLVKS